MPTDHVRVTGLHEDAVTTSQSGDHVTAIVLRLSGDPSEVWTSAFNLEWSRTHYLRKRSVEVGSVRVHGGAEGRRGLVVHASPEDYVAIHKHHVERAVAEANAQAAQRDRKQDATVARANRLIRSINADHYAGGATTGGAAPGGAASGGAADAAEPRPAANGRRPAARRDAERVRREVR